MRHSVRTNGLTAGTLFRVLFIGSLLSVGIIVLILAILALFGAHTIFFEERPITGILGFITGIIMAPIFAAIYAGITWLLIGFGQWLWTRFRTIMITYKTKDNIK